MLVRGLLPLAAIAAAAAIVGTSTAATGRQALQPAVETTPHGSIVQYLHTLGVRTHGKQIVVQRGTHNYVGATCPGITWTCTTPGKGKIVVQFAQRDAGNQVNCSASYPGSGSPPTNTPSDQECTVVQVATDGSDNNAQCSEKTSAISGVTQSCTIQQVNTTGNNNAQVNQQVNSNGTWTQDAKQDAEVYQQNQSGKNDAHVQQSVNQQTSDSDPSGTQTQDAHQTLSIEQTSDTGDNHADANQSQSQNENINQRGGGKNSPPQPVVQNQNEANGGPNENAAVYQSSGCTNPFTGSTLNCAAGGGNNEGAISQALDQHQNAPKNASGSQTQGSPNGGLNGHFDQESTGVSHAHGSQQEHQQQSNTVNTTQFSQKQIDPAWMGSPQGTNPNDQYQIDQHVDQQSGKGSDETLNIFSNCDTTGTCSAHEDANQNGNHQQNSCSGSSCHIATQCESVGEGSGCTATPNPTECDGPCPDTGNPPQPPALPPAPEFIPCLINPDSC